jgi:hypothetical protein
MGSQKSRNNPLFQSKMINDGSAPVPKSLCSSALWYASIRGISPSVGAMRYFAQPRQICHARKPQSPALTTLTLYKNSN